MVILLFFLALWFCPRDFGLKLLFPLFCHCDNFGRIKSKKSKREKKSMRKDKNTPNCFFHYPAPFVFGPTTGQLARRGRTGDPARQPWWPGCYAWRPCLGNWAAIAGLLLAVVENSKTRRGSDVRGRRKSLRLRGQHLPWWPDGPIDNDEYLYLPHACPISRSSYP